MGKRTLRKTNLPIPHRRRRPVARSIPLKDLCWRDLVRTARKSEPAFNVLLARLEGLISVIAFQYGPECRADVSQTARLKLWESLKKINTNRPNLAIRRAVTKVIRNAIISEARRLRQQARGLEYTGEDSLLCDAVVKPIPHTSENGRKKLKTYMFHVKTEVDDKHLMGKCQAYIRKHGTTQGMMFAVCKQVGRRRPISYLRRLLTIDRRFRDMPILVKRLVASKRRRKRKVK